MYTTVLGMAEARSVNLKNTHTHKRGRGWGWGREREGGVHRRRELKGECRGKGGEERESYLHLWYQPHRERSGVEDQALPFCKRHHFCRREVAPAGIKQFWAQDPAPSRRCGIEGTTGIRDGWEETVTGTGKGAGMETRTRTEMSTRTGIGART